MVRNKKIKKIPYPLVEILWLDATTHNQWIDIEDIQKEVGVDLTTTIGFLVKEDNTAYYVASTIHECMTNAQITLPKGMVQSVRFGRFVENRKKKPDGTSKIQDAVCS